jgi:hypothetical protein
MGQINVVISRIDGAAWENEFIGHKGRLGTTLPHQNACFVVVLS